MFHQRRLRKIEEQRDNLEEMERKNRQLRTLIEINTYIANSLEKDEVLKRILNQTKILLNCESSSILLVDRGLKQLNFSVLSKDEEGDILKDTSLRMGEGIAGTVWQNGIPILINDAQNDPRFSDRADKKAKTVTRSIIAVPLTVNGEIIGVIEAINKIHGGFTVFDMQVLQFVSTQSAIAINNASLYNNAIRDGMTKLYISKYFRERLQEEWNRSSRKGHTLSVVIFDIDNFKGINDTYGHQAGDASLKAVALTLASQVRDQDVVARIGGEEFAVLLPGTDLATACRIADRLRVQVAAIRLPATDSEQLTLSMGIADCKGRDCPMHGPQADHRDLLMHRADLALYQAKALGRNRVEVSL